MVYYESNELYHHGILGQKWGEKNGPPYPLKASAHSSAEKEAGWRKSLVKTEDEKGKNSVEKVLRKSGKHTIDKHEVAVNNVSNLQKRLGLSDQNYLKAKKIAKIAGIGIATGAGLYFLGCAMDGLNGTELLSKPVDELTREDVLNAIDGVNRDEGNKTKAFDLDDGLFANPYNGDYVGEKARAAGYQEIDADFLKDAIVNPSTASDEFYNDLYRSVRFDYQDDVSDRRLSCWSASTAHYLSVLTGKPFTSKNFQNAVDFNKFGKMFSEQPKIYDAFGKEAKTFVGLYGRDGSRSTPEVAYALAESILRNIDKSNNVSPDGKRTVGFINAGYNGAKLPHQWSFEIFYDDGIKYLTMIDGYGGGKTTVARQLPNGKIEPCGFMSLFEGEINAYNKDSIRFYATSLGTVDPEVMSKIVLGKP